MRAIYPPQDEHFPSDMLPIPPDLVRWWRRATTLERGMIHDFSLVVPKAKGGRVVWAVRGSAKLENEE